MSFQSLQFSPLRSQETAVCALDPAGWAPRHRTGCTLPVQSYQAARPSERILPSHIHLRSPESHDIYHKKAKLPVRFWLRTPVLEQTIPLAVSNSVGGPAPVSEGRFETPEMTMEDMVTWAKNNKLRAIGTIARNPFLCVRTRVAFIGQWCLGRSRATSVPAHAQVACGPEASWVAWPTRRRGPFLSVWPSFTAVSMLR